MGPINSKGIELLENLVAEALANPQFRQQLVDNPEQVLRDAGLHVPDDVEVVVHQNSSDRVHLVLPSRPVVGQQLDIDEVDVSIICEFWPV